MFSGLMRSGPLLLVALLLLGAEPARAEIVGPALVLADGSLKLGGRHARLYGIHTPSTGRTCRTRVRPAAITASSGA